MTAVITMNPLQKILTKLQAWDAQFQQLNDQAEALYRLTLAAPESPLMTALWSVWEAYTVALADNLNDQSEWLLWYWLECDMGAHPMAVVLDGKELKVGSTRQLARVLLHVNKAPEPAPHPTPEPDRADRTGQTGHCADRPVV